MTGLVHGPVRVWKQCSLNTSVSSISIPELPTSGDSWEPMANNLHVGNTSDEFWRRTNQSGHKAWDGNLRVEH